MLRYLTEILSLILCSIDTKRNCSKYTVNGLKNRAVPIFNTVPQPGTIQTLLRLLLQLDREPCRPRRDRRQPMRRAQVAQRPHKPSVHPGIVQRRRQLVLRAATPTPPHCSGAWYPKKPRTTCGNTKGYSSTYLAMGFANVRAGTFQVPA